MIQEKMGLLQAEEDAKRGIMRPKEEPMPPIHIEEERFEQNKMEVEFSHQQLQQQQQVQQMQQVQQDQQVQHQENHQIHLEENGE